MNSSKNLIIIGAGQLGVLISKIIKKTYKFKIVGFIDNDLKKKGKKINGIRVIGNDKILKKKKEKLNIVIAVGNIKKRIEIKKKFKKKNFLFPKIIASSAKIDENVKIGNGTVITNHTMILNNTKIGEFCIIGSGNKILHHVNISNNCIIGGGTVIGSNAKIKENVFVGVGSVLASRRIIIGKNSFICSGSAVFKSMKAGSKAIGNPARIIPNKKKII